MNKLVELKEKERMKDIKKIVLLFFVFVASTLILVGCKYILSSDQSTVGNNSLINNRFLQVDACDLNGNRQALVKVDIGYGDRLYFGYTNEYKQLIRVEAKEIVLQNRSELLTNKGRYCNDEAKVIGTKQKEFDEGHVIADSLGGVSNAYNITPQNSKVNREGAQSKMEEEIRQLLHANKKITDFVAVIDYSDTSTQTPKKYHIEFKVNGKLKVYEFENK